MGDLVNLKTWKDDAAPRRRIRPEAKGYLLVPARILETLKRLEDSVDAYSVDTTNKKHIEWNAYYGIVACLEMATRYQ